MKLLDKIGFTLIQQKEAKLKVTGKMIPKNSKIISPRFILAK